MPQPVRKTRNRESIMPRRKSRTLTELELEIMQVVWRKDEIAVEEIRTAIEETGKPLALPSIRKMLSILQEKGYVSRRAKGRGHLYRAVVSESQAHRGFLADLVERAFDGSATDLVAALLKSKMVSKREIKEVKRLIEEHEGGTKK